VIDKNQLSLLKVMVIMMMGVCSWSSLLFGAWNNPGYLNAKARLESLIKEEQSNPRKYTPEQIRERHRSLVKTIQQTYLLPEHTTKKESTITRPSTKGTVARTAKVILREEISSNEEASIQKSAHLDGKSFQEMASFAIKQDSRIKKKFWENQNL